MALTTVAQVLSSCTASALNGQCRCIDVRQPVLGEPTLLVAGSAKLARFILREWMAGCDIAKVHDLGNSEGC